MSKENDEKKDRRVVILFSTRFLEMENSLFCENNINSKEYCKSSGYLKLFLSKDLPFEIIQYFNYLYCKDFFVKFKDESDKDEDGLEDIEEKLWGRIPAVQYKKPAWKGFFSDLVKQNKLIEITVNTERKKFEIGDRTINEKDLLQEIIKHERTPVNNGIVLNTDFGCAYKKKTIDRRFKIYKLKDCKIENVQAVYGVWCLGQANKDTEWYSALYEEVKKQLGDDFSKVTEVLFFLHDGDIGEKDPFKVNHYMATNETFGFLDEKITLSVAIFQHSLSPIATALSNPDIDKALRSVQKSMEKGGKLAFLNELSDNVARWHAEGGDLFAENIKNQNIYLKDEELITEEDQKSIENLRKKIKRLIDETH